LPTGQFFNAQSGSKPGGSTISTDNQ
jgi:hypothetical protein